ncbi:MAG TPA: VOC family protein [Aliidongia sp.]|nr:VOC family protein [Aliidongia sp.]
MPDYKGKFVWYELMTSNMQAAERFYHSVLGWTAKSAGMPDMDYTLFSAGDRQVAGMMGQPAPGAHPGWLGYVAVEDVDASAAQVKQAGGAVHHEPSDIPGVGRFAVIADPHGAAIALFKGASEGPPPVAQGTPGHTGWHELHAGNLEQDFAFYAKLFGWTKSDAMDMGEMGVYQLFEIQGTQSGGMMTKMAATPMPHWLYYFAVADIDGALALVKSGGGQVLNGPVQVPGGSWIIQALDPQGAAFALVGQRKV